MIRSCAQSDFEAMYAIINDAAHAYQGVIPADRWTEPYMSREYLQHEIDDGVAFWGYEENGELIGVMGIQDVQDVTLIRHAYVRTAQRGKGIGGALLSELKQMTRRPTLVGTWKAAVWAIRFYEKHGFRLVTEQQKEQLLRKYWKIPERQVETSVVLADRTWFESSTANGTENAKYGMAMIDNLQHIKKYGIRHFVRNEQERWTCPACSELLCVHRPQCLSCGHTWR